MRFGTAGIPSSTVNPDTINGIKRARELNLGAMELAFVRSVYINENAASEVKKVARENDVALTAHASYYINLNAKEPYKARASVKRILKAARILNMCGGKNLVVHAGYYMGKDPEDTYDMIHSAFSEITKVLKEEGINIWIRPEVMGKRSQFGSLKEIIRLSKDFDNVLPCLDIAHWFARNTGRRNSLEDFREVLNKIKEELGMKAVKNMHIHCSGIHYSEKGERYHLPLEESEFNYKDFLRALKEIGADGILISESPLQEKDALLMKSIFLEQD